MAEETVQDQPAPKAWTPTSQAASSEVKVIKLLELGENEKGRFARVEFDDESSRPLYLLTVADAWHPIFNTLKAAEAWKIRDHFNKRFPELPRTSGMRKAYKYASFVTETLGPRGGYMKGCYFDLSAHQDVSGDQAGIAVARELLELYATGNCHCISLKWMFNDMAAAEGRHAKDARDAFLRAVDESLQFFARYANYQLFLDRESARYAKTEEWLAGVIAKERIEFVQRMKAAREAKRQMRRMAEDETAPAQVAG